MRTTILLAGIAALGFATGAASQAQSFDALDVNRDGRLSFSEAFSVPQISNNFSLLDSNADGLLSRSELSVIPR